MAIARKFSDQIDAFCQMAARLAELHNAEAILFLTERPTEWDKLQAAVGDHTLIVAADSEDALAGAEDSQFDTVLLSVRDLPVYEQLTEALLEAVADDHLAPGASVVAVYSGFEADTIDSLSIIRLGEHLGRLTIRDLKQLAAKVPTETLKIVVDLAVAIGREGREGKPVGTMLIVGDHRKTLTYCKPMGFDPVRGYPISERTLSDAKVREGVKEIAQMDGAFVVSASGTVVAACQHVSAPPAELSISKGLGARHWAAAEITQATTAVAVAVSESNGTVRLFQNGEVVLRIEPFRRAMKWRDFEPDMPEKEKESDKDKDKAE